MLRWKQIFCYFQLVGHWKHAQQHSYSSACRSPLHPPRALWAHDVDKLEHGCVQNKVLSQDGGLNIRLELKLLAQFSKQFPILCLVINFLGCLGHLNAWLLVVSLRLVEEGRMLFSPDDKAQLEYLHLPQPWSGELALLPLCSFSCHPLPLFFLHHSLCTPSCFLFSTHVLDHHLASLRRICLAPDWCTVLGPGPWPQVPPTLAHNIPVTAALAPLIAVIHIQWFFR